MKKEVKILVLGIGNIGRQDDGLGWLILDYLKEEDFENLDLEYRYQLQIEDSELISQYHTIIMVDAVKHKVKNGFYFKECNASNKFSFSTHDLLPETVLFLTNKLYHNNSRVFILGIQGFKWDLKIGLSNKAKINLEKVKNYIFENIHAFSRFKYV